MKARWVALVLGLVSGVTVEAQAANRRSFFFGGEAAQTGAALMARTRATDALFYNPAGLARQRRARLDLSMTAFNLRLQSVGDALQVTFPDGEESADLAATELQPVPAALVFGRRLSERVGYAYGVFVTESTDNRFDARVGRDDLDVPGVGLVDTRSGINGQELDKTYSIGGGLGWSVTPRLRLGFGLFVLYNRRISRVQIFSSAVAQTDASSSFILVTESADVKVVGLSPTVALQWEATDELDFGVILRPPPFSIYTWGDRTPLVSGPTPQGDQQLEADREGIDEWKVEPLAPMSVELMAAWSKGKNELGATFELVPALSNRGTVRLNTDFQWNLRLGARHHFSDAVSVGIGLYTDRNVERSEEGDLSRGVDYYGATTGVRFEQTVGMDREIAFTTTLAFGYAAGVGTVDGVVIDPLGSIDDIGRSDIDVLFHELSLSFASGFEF